MDGRVLGSKIDLVPGAVARDGSPLLLLVHSFFSCQREKVLFILESQKRKKVVL